MSARDVHRATFTAMSATVTICGVGITRRQHEEAMAFARAQAEFWEERFSRFRPHSQLSRLNAANGEPCPVDAVFIDILPLAAKAVARTGGMFDPSILPALEAAGYDRSIERVRDGDSALDTPVPAMGVTAWRSVVIDASPSAVTLPRGMRIDLGGIAKGAFVDALVTHLGWWPGGCIDVGGDLRVWGVPPSGEWWTVGIEDPARPGENLAVVALTDEQWRGVATSAMNRRRWRAGGETQHHLIDPARGRPLRADLASVTAFASTVATAEVTTKALLVASARGVPADLAGSALAVCVYASGHVAVLQERPNDAPIVATVDRT